MNRKVSSNNFLNQSVLYGAILVPVIPVLYIISRHNYLLLHSLTEGFSIITAGLICVLATRTYKYSANNYLLFLGYAYFFVAAFDFFHLLAYPGMGVFPGIDSNVPTQLWIAGRYVDAASLFLAVFFIRRQFPRASIFGAYFLITVFLLLSIFGTGAFPDCFVAGKGLTPFKIYSEYTICLIILAAAGHLYFRKETVNTFLYRTMTAAMFVTIASELSFTLYNDAYGIMNFTGHIFKIMAYFLVFRGIVVRSLDAPHEIIFKELTDKEKKLRNAHRQLQDIIDLLPDATIVVDKAGRVIAWNRAIEEMTGVPKEDILGKAEYAYAVPFYQKKRPILLDYFFLDYKTSLETNYEYIRKKGPTVFAEVFIPTMFQGEGAYLWCKASPLLDTDGNLTGAIQSIRNITERRLAEEKLKRLSFIDGLTGIANRRYFDEFLEREWKRARRGKYYLSLVMCDIDCFKAYNDHYGHLKGDECLKKVAHALKETKKRPGDLAARYGGEEFAVVLPETGPKDAVSVAQALRTGVEALGIEHVKSEADSSCLTISLGVASIIPDAKSSPETLIALADKALYRAKKAGRNRVEFMPE